MTEPRSTKKAYTDLNTQGKKSLTTWEIVVFAMLGTLMFCSKIAMQALPNIHLLGMLIMTYTVVFRVKALIPIYIYVILEGIFAGFNIWWIQYLYIWTVLWALTMLLPKDMPKKVKYVVYPLICCVHGLLFGLLYSPAYALIMKMDLKAMLSWVVAGFPFDAIHGLGNLVLGLLIVPLSELLKKLMSKEIIVKK